MPAKITELIILEIILEHMEESEVIRDNQHILTKGRSCLSNLVELYDGMTALLVPHHREAMLSRGTLTKTQVNFMNFSKTKCKVLHVDLGNAQYQERLGGERIWEQRRIWGCRCMKNWAWASKNYTLGCIKETWPAGWGEGVILPTTPFLWNPIGNTPSSFVCPCGLHSAKKHGSVEAGPEQG